MVFEVGFLVSKVVLGQVFAPYSNLQLQSHSLLIYSGTGIASQVQWLSTGWTVRVSNPGGGERYSLLNICPASLFPGSTAATACIKHPPSSSDGVENGYSFICTSPLCLHAILRGDLYLYSSIIMEWYSRTNENHSNNRSLIIPLLNYKQTNEYSLRKAN
jgi:hypothetical protein